MPTVTVLSSILLNGGEPTSAACMPEKTSDSLLIPTVVDASKDQKALQDDGTTTFTVELRPTSPDFTDLEKTLCERQHFFSPSPHGFQLALHIDVSSSSPNVTADASDNISVGSPLDPPGIPVLSMDAEKQQSLRAPPSLVLESYTKSPKPTPLPSSDSPTHASSEPEPLLPSTHDALLDIDPSVLEFDTSHFLLNDVPLLDTLIPPELMPDDLLVHDLSNITGLFPRNDFLNNKHGKMHMKTDMPVRYVRMYPASTHPPPPKRPTETDAVEGDGAPSSEDTPGEHVPRRTAHIYLQRKNYLGSGNHSTVFRGGLRLKHAHGASMETRQVAVKAAGEECGAHAMLLHEARMYDRFPRALMEHHVPPPPSTQNETSESNLESRHDVECNREGERPQSCEGGRVAGVSSEPTDSDNVSSLSVPSASASEESKISEHLSPEECAKAESEPPVVPKFFGFYAPAREGSDQPDLRSHKEQGCDLDSECCVEGWPTGLLLIEDCGTPIEADDFEQQHRCVVSSELPTSAERGW